MGIRNMKLGRGKGKTEIKLRRTRDLGFILTTIMTLRSTTYRCGPQLNIAPSAAHDRQTYITETSLPPHSAITATSGRTAHITSHEVF